MELPLVIKRYTFIRRFGLALSILAVVKLFLIDLSFLTEGYKIISYFVFGMTLLAISFVYQYFSKRIESIGKIIPDDKKEMRTDLKLNLYISVFFLNSNEWCLCVFENMAKIRVLSKPHCGKFQKPDDRFLLKVSLLYLLLPLI